jgi:hypothetical protein
MVCRAALLMRATSSDEGSNPVCFGARKAFKALAFRFGAQNCFKALVFC